MTPDRRELLLAQNQFTGIDFVYVHSTQVTLDVFFICDPATLAVPMPGTIAESAVHITSPTGGEGKPVVPVTGVAWTVNAGRQVLRLTTAFPGAFSIYRLRIEDARIDRFYNDVPFRFQVNCPSEFDCKPADDDCCAEPLVDAAVDYTARDYGSFRQALIDFSTTRHPRWQERLEADAGMMMLETLSAVADELAYTQDFVARQPYIDTASERRSVRSLAALVDYTVHDGHGAVAWLDFQVNAAGLIPAGTDVTSADGRIVFQVGKGLRDSFDAPPKQFAVNPVRNRMLVHQWDEDDVCLPCGSTEVWVNGALKAALPPDDTTPDKAPGKWMLLQTKPSDPAIPERAWMVRVIDVFEDFDFVIDPVGPVAVTRLRWEQQQATPFDLDMTILGVHGNLVLGTAGRTLQEVFAIENSPATNDPTTVERRGPDTLEQNPGERSVTHRFSLPGTGSRRLLSDPLKPGERPRTGEGLVWLNEFASETDPRTSQPEVRLREVDALGNAVPGGSWTWTRSFIGVRSALADEPVFSLDDGTWTRIAGYQRIGREIVHRDYADGAGVSILWGNQSFGRIPAAGVRFEATYRVGRGSEDNVAAGTLKLCVLPIVDAVNNPLAATTGQDPEPLDDVRHYAPEAFRAETFRAVRPEDYAAAAEKLDWVQRAGATFRWTGSWLTCFTAADPRGSVGLTPEQRTDLGGQLNRYRQAGRPAYPMDPRYASLDLVIEVCVASSAYRGEVKERVLEALFGRGGARPKIGFFSPDNFTLGTPLERSSLEAAIQEVEGVRAVEDIVFRRRAAFSWRPFDELIFTVAPNEVIRVENSALLPDRGSVRLVMRGGA